MNLAEGPDGRATLRDIGAAQREMREELRDVHQDLGDRIDKIGDTVTELKDGLYPRVAVLERDNDQNKTDISGLRSDLAGLLNVRERAVGHLSAWKLLGGIVGGAGTIVLADVVIHWIGA